MKKLNHTKCHVVLAAIILIIFFLLTVYITATAVYIYLGWMWALCAAIITVMVTIMFFWSYLKKIEMKDR